MCSGGWSCVTAMLGQRLGVARAGRAVATTDENSKGEIIGRMMRRKEKYLRVGALAVGRAARLVDGGVARTGRAVATGDGSNQRWTMRTKCENAYESAQLQPD